MKELIQALINQGIITATDIQRMTTLELLLTIVERVNELHGLTKEGLEAVQRLLDKGVQEEVVAQFDEWLQDGTFDTLINQTALKTVNDRIDETNTQVSDVKKYKNDQLYVEVNLNHYADIAKSGTPDEDWTLAFNHVFSMLKGEFGLIKFAGILKIKSPINLPYGVDLEGTSLPNSGFLIEDDFVGNFCIVQNSDRSHVNLRNIFFNFQSSNKVGGVKLTNPYDYSTLDNLVGNNSRGSFLEIGGSSISQTLRVQNCIVYACNSVTEPLVILNNLQEGCFINNKFMGQQSNPAQTDLVVCDGETTTLFLNNSFASTTKKGLVLKSAAYQKRINANKVIGNLFELCGDTVIELTGANSSTLEAEYNYFSGNDTLFQQGKMSLSNCTNTTVLDRIAVVNGSGARRTFAMTPYNQSAKDAYSNTSILSENGGLKGKFIGDFYFDKGRAKQSVIKWDASAEADYGLKFIIDGNPKVAFQNNNICNETNGGGLTLKDGNGKHWVLRINAEGQVVVTDY